MSKDELIEMIEGTLATNDNKQITAEDLRLALSAIVENMGTESSGNGGGSYCLPINAFSATAPESENDIYKFSDEEAAEFIAAISNPNTIVTCYIVDGEEAISVVMSTIIRSLNGEIIFVGEINYMGLSQTPVLGMVEIDPSTEDVLGFYMVQQ
jgi:hypothetical protein